MSPVAICPECKMDMTDSVMRVYTRLSASTSMVYHLRASCPKCLKESAVDLDWRITLHALNVLKNANK